MSPPLKSHKLLKLENVMASEVIEANLTYEYHSFIHVLPFKHKYISM